MTSKVPNTTAQQGIQEDSFKYSPLEHVRSLFVGFLQGLFSAAPIGAYHWEPNDEQSQIYISDENQLKSETIGFRPAISCTRSPVQFYSLGLDDMLAYDFQTGTKRKSVLVPGTMVLNCCSRASLESERIAWICAENLWLHREQLLKAGFFEIGRQPAIGSPSAAGSIIIADSGDEWYTTPVTCPYQFYRTSQFSPLNKTIVKNIGLSISAQLQAVNQQNVRIGGKGGAIETDSANLPVEIHTCPPSSFAPLASDVNGYSPTPGGVTPRLPIVPHPLNPAQLVVVRAARPNDPAVRPPSINGRTIPIVAPVVEDLCRTQLGPHVTTTTTIKV